MHYILDENGEKLADKGFHRIESTGLGYRAKLGAAVYTIEPENGSYQVRRDPRGRSRDIYSVDATLDPEKTVKTGDRLDPEKQRVESENEDSRETLQQTKVGFPGLRANRVIEKYEDEEGVETHEYRTEVVVLGKRFPIEKGTVKYGEDGRSHLEKDLENELEVEYST